MFPSPPQDEQRLRTGLTSARPDIWRLSVLIGHNKSPVNVTFRGDGAAGAGPIPISAPAWPAVASATRRTKYRLRRSLPGEPPYRLTGRSRCRRPGCTRARSNRLCGDRALPGTPGRYPAQQSSLLVAQPARAPPFLPDQEGRAREELSPPEKQQAASRRMSPGVNSPASIAHAMKPVPPKTCNQAATHSKRKSSTDTVSTPFRECRQRHLPRLSGRSARLHRAPHRLTTRPVRRQQPHPPSDRPSPQPRMKSTLRPVS